jgi:transposase-like protein
MILSSSFSWPVREKLSSEVRAVITDRIQSQINAITQVFPNASIVFCRVRIMRNVEQNFGPQHAATTVFC